MSEISYNSKDSNAKSKKLDAVADAQYFEGFSDGVAVCLASIALVVLSLLITFKYF